MENFTFCQSISYFEFSRIVYPDKFPRKGCIDQFLADSHESGRIQKSHLRVFPYVMVKFIAFKFSADDPKKSNPIPMLWIHIGMYLKDETTESFFSGIHDSFL